MARKAPEATGAGPPLVQKKARCLLGAHRKKCSQAQGAQFLGRAGLKFRQSVQVQDWSSARDLGVLCGPKCEQKLEDIVLVEELKSYSYHMSRHVPPLQSTLTQLEGMQPFS
jgi:hypothetical protein